MVKCTTKSNSTKHKEQIERYKYEVCVYIFITGYKHNFFLKIYIFGN